jgi:hypothetical protein
MPHAVYKTGGIWYNVPSRLWVSVISMNYL